jgi:integrase
MQDERCRFCSARGHNKIPPAIAPSLQSLTNLLWRNSYRTREHVTETEVGAVLEALRRNRNGHRDRLMGLLCFRHGLRVSELIDLQWADIAFDQGEA